MDTGIAIQFRVPPLMAKSLSPCCRCATSKAKACCTPAACTETGQLGKVGPGQWAACSGKSGKCMKPLSTPSPANVCC